MKGKQPLMAFGRVSFQVFIGQMLHVNLQLDIRIRDSFECQRGHMDLVESLEEVKSEGINPMQKQIYWLSF